MLTVMNAMVQLTFWLSTLLATTSIPVINPITVPGLQRPHQQVATSSVQLVKRLNDSRIERISNPADTLKTDPETGLALDEKLMVVKAHCTSCHSPKLITQNRFTRDGWKEKIRWMQRTQKLWDLGESEPAVLDYLTKHYGPETKAFDGRRMPLKNVKWYELN